MGLDQDVSNNAAVAFGPASTAEGAIVPYEGREFVRRPEGPWAAALEADADGWLTPDTPVLVRGQARILPLAWWGAPHNDAGPSPEALAELGTQMEGSGYYWARSARTLDELKEHSGDSIASYARGLADAGATDAKFWAVSDTIGVALVWAGDVDAGTRSLALHIIPASWISERRAGKAVRGIDMRWSWADVVGLAAG